MSGNPFHGNSPTGNMFLMKIKYCIKILYFLVSSLAPATDSPLIIGSLQSSSDCSTILYDFQLVFMNCSFKIMLLGVCILVIMASLSNIKCKKAKIFGLSAYISTANYNLGSSGSICKLGKSASLLKMAHWIELRDYSLSLSKTKEIYSFGLKRLSHDVDKLRLEQVRKAFHSAMDSSNSSRK
ncbi:hypothetical protein V8E54_010546 [Elaphomyces granulatus]